MVGGPSLFSAATRDAMTESSESTEPEPASSSGIQAKKNTMSAPV